MKQRDKNIYRPSFVACKKCTTLCLEISHRYIKQKQLDQPFYYSKWYKCTKCGWRIQFEKDKIWNNNDKAIYMKQVDELERQQHHLFSIRNEI